MELSNLNLPLTFDELDQRLPSQDLTQWSGAVNFLFVEDRILLIKRSNEMPSHRGQIGFFGGHKTNSEVEPVQTAKREFTEESGINGDELEFLGLHQPVRTSHSRLIVPALCKYKGSVDQFLNKALSNGEWSDLVAVEIQALQKNNLWTKAQAYSASREFEFYFFPLLFEYSQYQNKDIAVPYTLWGASAKMILNFFKNPKLSDKFL